jgi:hypothetical protein
MKETQVKIEKEKKEARVPRYRYLIQQKSPGTSKSNFAVHN